jgi:hypothetical protein
MSLLFQIFGGTLIALFSVLLTYFITSKNSEKKVYDMESKMMDCVKRIISEHFTNHMSSEHKVDMFKYIDEELGKHKSDCGARLSIAINNFDMKLQKMEIRQVRLSMKTNLLLSFVEKMAQKMGIVADIDSMNKEGEDE